MPGRLPADTFEVTFKFKVKILLPPAGLECHLLNKAKRNEESNFMRVLPDKERPEVLVEQRLMFEENC